MPATEARQAEGAIRATVTRLARPDGDGGAVIERAAIVAEGEPAVAIEAWIVAHGGQPEVPLLSPPRPGLYGPRHEGLAAHAARPPRRYILPAAELD
jgi:hypothetical protein